MYLRERPSQHNRNFEIPKLLYNNLAQEQNSSGKNTQRWTSNIFLKNGFLRYCPNPPTPSSSQVFKRVYAFFWRLNFSLKIMPRYLYSGLYSTVAFWSLKLNSHRLPLSLNCTTPDLSTLITKRHFLHHFETESIITCMFFTESNFKEISVYSCFPKWHILIKT